MDVEDIVDTELSSMPQAQLEALRECLVTPRPQERHRRSCRLEPGECWVVAERDDEVIAYCDADRLEGYPWGVLERDSEDFGTDDRWYASLREALDAAGWI